MFDKDGDTFAADETLLREADKALISETALQLKRVIEAAVLSAHPGWAHSGMVGEEVQAFSDFLVYILESQTIISDWAVVVFDASSGFVDVYRGQGYKDEVRGRRRSLCFFQHPHTSVHPGPLPTFNQWERRDKTHTEANLVGVG